MIKKKIFSCPLGAAEFFFLYFLSRGQLVTGTSKAWLGGLGEIGKPYTHPTTKQCSYAYTHPTAKQCNYSYTHPTTKQCNYSVDTSQFATIAYVDSKIGAITGVSVSSTFTFTSSTLTLSKTLSPGFSIYYIELTVPSTAITFSCHDGDGASVNVSGTIPSVNGIKLYNGGTYGPNYILNTASDNSYIWWQLALNNNILTMSFGAYYRYFSSRITWYTDKTITVSGKAFA